MIETRTIDADALYMAIDEGLKDPEYQHHDDDWYVGMIDAQSLLNEQPTIEPEHKKGKWERKSYYDETLICSCCYLEGRWDWAFCPFCGCEMEEYEING